MSWWTHFYEFSSDFTILFICMNSWTEFIHDFICKFLWIHIYNFVHDFTIFFIYMNHIWIHDTNSDSESWNFLHEFTFMNSDGIFHDLWIQIWIHVYEKIVKSYVKSGRTKVPDAHSNTLAANLGFRSSSWRGPLGYEHLLLWTPAFRAALRRPRERCW